MIFTTRLLLIFILILPAFLQVSCSSYKQNIMFKVPDGGAVQGQVHEAEKNYIIAPNDYLELKVFTNEGERAIDPDLFLRKDMPQVRSEQEEPRYLVNVSGVVKFPMIGEINVNGLTIRQAEAILQTEYARFYQKPFVSLVCTSKRIVVLGAPGGKIVPLTYDNMRLVEVLASVEGVQNNAKATNIRILRGDSVFVADLSTFEGYKKYNMIMKPGDVVYVEPVRKPFVEGTRDYAVAISMMTSLVTLVLLITQL